MRDSQLQVKMASAALTALVRETPLVAPCGGVEVATSISRVLANVRTAVNSRKVRPSFSKVTFVYYKNCVRAGDFNLRHSQVLNGDDQLARLGRAGLVSH